MDVKIDGKPAEPRSSGVAGVRFMADLFTRLAEIRCCGAEPRTVAMGLSRADKYLTVSLTFRITGPDGEQAVTLRHRLDVPRLMHAVDPWSILDSMLRDMAATAARYKAEQTH